MQKFIIVIIFDIIDLNEEEKVNLDSNAAKIGANVAKAGSYIYGKGKSAVKFIAENGTIITVVFNKKIQENETVKTVAGKTKDGVFKVADIIGNVY